MRLIIPAICLIINIQEIIINKTGWTWLSYFDEAILILPYILAPFAINKKNEAWLYLILFLPFASFIYTIIINYATHPSLLIEQALIQSFINFKFFLYFVLFYTSLKLTQSSGNSKLYSTSLLFCLFASLLGYIFNVLSPEFFVFSDASWHLERNRISGFQFKPNDLAILLGLSTLFILYSKQPPSRKLIYISALTFLIIFSASRTALIFPAIALLATLSRRGHSPYLLATIAIGMITGTLLSDKILNSFAFTETLKNLQEFSSIQSSQYIRGIMLYLGTKLSLSYFPIGTGAGNFGTVMSANSPVYNELGVANSYFFANSIGIYDSNIASILGEYGVIGIILYSYLFIKTLNFLLKENTEQKYIFLALVGFMVFVQPIFSYQVNSINLLLVIFSIRQMNLSVAKIKIKAPQHCS